MEKTRYTLLAQFVGIVTAVVVIVLFFETGILEEGILVDSNSHVEFAFTAVMELLTIAMIPLALKLFKFKRVEAQLQTEHEVALCKWGVLRLAMLELPLMLNTLLYYLFLNTSFGYMAIILLLCLAFVFPTKAKCEAEAFGNELKN